VRTTEVGGECGYDAGKKVKGRKRHVVVDTLGHLIEVVVHAASIQNRDGAKLVFAKLSQATKDRLRKLRAECGYAGALIDWVREHLDAILAMAARDPEQPGFHVLPRRWVVERTFAWFGRYRRLSKDYEKLTESSEAMVYLASIHIMLKRTPVAA
jgi:putative transposase